MSSPNVVDDLHFNPESKLYRREDGKEIALVHDIDRDLWVSETGAEYVQNINRIANPIYLRIDTNVWRFRHTGRAVHINWSKLKLHETPKLEIKSILIKRLRQRVPTEIATTQSVCASLAHLGQTVVNLDRSIGALESHELISLLLAIGEVSNLYSSYFRSLYADMVAYGLPGCTSSKLEQIEQLRLSGGGYATAIPH